MQQLSIKPSSVGQHCPLKFLVAQLSWLSQLDFCELASVDFGIVASLPESSSSIEIAVLDVTAVVDGKNPSLVLIQ